MKALCSSWTFRLALVGLVLTCLLSVVGLAVGDARGAGDEVSARGSVGTLAQVDPDDSFLQNLQPRKITVIRQLDSRDYVRHWGNRLVSFMGVLLLIGLCWLFSNNRDAVNWRLVAIGMGLQLAFAFLILKTEPGHWVFDQLNDAVTVLLGFTNEGTNFLFKSFALNRVHRSFENFAFNVLPTIIFFSSLMTVLYHLGIMQVLVRCMAVIMQKTMGISGAESLSAAANIFVGQTEAPLVIKPYVEKMTESELMTVMTGGFATVAGGVMAAYVGILRSTFPDIAGHLIAASVMSAPAAIVAAKLMFPETRKPLTQGSVKMHVDRKSVNVVDAATRGAGDGLKLALNVGAMLLAFIALVAMCNFFFQKFGLWLGIEGYSLEALFGYVFWPIAYIMGVPAADCAQIGTLLGEKMVLNEFVAYYNLGQILEKGNHGLDYRSVVIATYALCGFANFSSIAIQIGGIGGIAPNRRSDLARIGFRAMIGGSLAAFMTATIAGMLI